MEIKAESLVYIEEAVERFGSPLYVYDLGQIEENISYLRRHIHSFKIRYAVKTNPNPWLLNWMQGRVDSMDVSSSGELRQVKKLGWSGDDVAFTGPAKTKKDLHLALKENVKSIVVEDISEAQWLNEVARETGVTARILLRIAPAKAESKFGVRLAGRPTQFGVDEDKLPDFFRQLEALESVRLDGFHVYSGSQCLDDEAMVEHFFTMWEIFKRAIRLYDKPISELVFGAGMGIPFHDAESSLSLESLPAAIAKIEKEIAELAFPVASFIELGRFIVGTAGYFVTQVIRVKNSMGSNIAICDGGMNNNLGACGHMGGVAHRHYSMVNVSAEPGTPLQKYKIVGPLCTAIDTLAHRIELPELSSGDLLAIGCGGSYGPTASPVYFISHDLPCEVVVENSSGKAEFTDVSWLPSLGG